MLYLLLLSVYLVCSNYEAKEAVSLANLLPPLIQAPKPITSTSMTPALERRVDQLEADLKQLQSRFTRLLGEYNTAQMKLKQRIYTLESSSRNRSNQH